MPLGTEFDHVLITHPCPHCGHGLEKPGSWFRTVAGFHCAQCGARNRITYGDRLRLLRPTPH